MPPPADQLRNIAMFQFSGSNRRPKISRWRGLHWVLFVAFLIFAQLCVSSYAQSTAAPEEAPLTLNVDKVVDSEISGKQTQNYQITLGAGQFASVTVQQAGIDVVARLFGPDKKLINEIDSESRLSGREIVEVVAQTSGAYRIEISPVYKFAPSGRYQIRFAELRAATERDGELDEARRLHMQAHRQYQSGDPATAIKTERSSLAIRQRVLGGDHPEVASSLFGLGLYYRNDGDIPEAENSYLQALAIREKAFGPDDLAVSLVLNNLAFLYYNDLRDYTRAQTIYERSLAIKEKALGPDHPFVAGTLGNMGLVYWKQKDYARAADCFRRTLAILEKTEGPETDHFATYTFDLGIIYKETGDYEKGEVYYRRALGIWEKVFGNDHPRITFALESLGILFRDKGDYQTAEPFLQRALDIETRKEGASHPDVANTLVILARLYEAKGDTARAIEYQSRAAEIEEKNIERNLTLGSERQKLAYFSHMSNEGNRRLSLHIRSAPNDSKARDLAFTMVLQRKGRVLDALADSAAAFRKSSSAQDQTLVKSLNDVRAQLARMVLEGPNGSISEHEKAVADLEARRDELEEELSRRSAGLYQPSRAVTIDAVKKVLPDDAALIEYAIYHPSDAKLAIEHDTPTEPRYVAYVLRNRGEVEWRDLGPAQDVNRAVGALRRALADPQRGDVQQLARVLDEKLLQPLRPLLGDSRQLIISPDGELNLVPFAALVDEHDHYLLERYLFTYLTSGRDLLRPQVQHNVSESTVVVADPVFGAPPLIAANNGRGGKNIAEAGAPKRVDYSQIFFGPLPGVSEEVRALKILLPAATFFTREQATKAALEKLSSPGILHIATHAFFLQEQPDATARAAAQPNKNTRLAKLAGHTANPLLRSGLALAGANQSANTDGILTALEMSGLNLSGTKLVVLSACDTGVGEVKNGEGVYGLRRALVLAGAESQVMSLWAVSDRSTRELIVGYYRALLQGTGRGEALRQVQLQMLHNRAQHHPYYWAGFIQTGEWANLAGKR
jgi:CHAT domain-containing protein/Tfp pilus assembly protein PilF